MNGYRMREVQRRIEADDARTRKMRALALDAGFASKSTFNQAFKKHVNKTASSSRSSRTGTDAPASAPAKPERFHDLLHDELAVHASSGLSTVGLAAEKASWQQARAAMCDLRHDVHAVLANGDMESARCVVTGTVRGTYAGVSPDGKRFTVDR